MITLEYQNINLNYYKCIELGSKSAVTYFLRGYTHFYIGNYFEAKSDYEKGIEIDPKFDDANNLMNELNFKIKAKAYDYLCFGKEEFQAGNIEKAISYWEKSLYYDPNDPKLCEVLGNAYYSRGISYYENFDYNNAIIDFEHAQELFSNIKNNFERFYEGLASAYYNRGINYYKTNEKNNALADWRRAYELFPNDEHFLKNFARINYKFGIEHSKIGIDMLHNKNYEEAIINTTEAIKYFSISEKLKKTSSLSEEISANYYNRSNAHFYMGHYELMISDLLVANKLTANDPSILKNLSIGYERVADDCYNKGEFTKALDYLYLSLQNNQNKENIIEKIDIIKSNNFGTAKIPDTAEE